VVEVVDDDPADTSLVATVVGVEPAVARSGRSGRSCTAAAATAPARRAAMAKARKRRG
jgi:hypothetical protein